MHDQPAATMGTGNGMSRAARRAEPDRVSRGQRDTSALGDCRYEGD
ncbi:MAG: hypothetical protein R2795_13290 [Saprospiraceae bacterium]